MGAVTAVSEAKLVGKVDIIGLDRDSNTLDMIKQGKIRGTIIQDDATMLYWAMVDLISTNYYLRTAMLSSDNVKAGAKLTPNRIETAINYVDKTNVDLFIAANKVYVAK
jgi:ABC-type sugar transport system substrate-binding protein